MGTTQTSRLLRSLRIWGFTNLGGTGLFFGYIVVTSMGHGGGAAGIVFLICILGLLFSAPVNLFLPFLLRFIDSITTTAGRIVAGLLTILGLCAGVIGFFFLVFDISLYNHDSEVILALASPYVVGALTSYFILERKYITQKSAQPVSVEHILDANN